MKYCEEKYKKILGVENVFIRNNEIIITGSIEDGDDQKHDCDEMGCGSMEHILLRGQFRFVQKGYCEDTQEAHDGQA